MASLCKHKIEHTSKVFINSFLVKYIRKRIHQNFQPLKILLCIVNPVVTLLCGNTKEENDCQIFCSHFQRLNQHTIKSAFHTQY